MRAALALLAFAAVFSYGSIWSSPWLLLVVLAALGVANARFLVFFARARGPLFALGALLFHQLYYGYSSASFASALVKHYVAHLGVKSTTS
jgi:hypothetical protein